MAATKVSARGIEERWFREYFRHAWNIAAARCGDSEVAVLLAVDNDQRIMGADQIARRVFGLNDAVLNRAWLWQRSSSMNPRSFGASGCKMWRLVCFGQELMSHGMA